MQSEILKMDVNSTPMLEAAFFRWMLLLTVRILIPCPRSLVSMWRKCIGDKYCSIQRQNSVEESFANTKLTVRHAATMDCPMFRASA